MKITNITELNKITNSGIVGSSGFNKKYLEFGGTNEYLSFTAINIGTTHSINCWFKYPSTGLAWIIPFGYTSNSNHIIGITGGTNLIHYINASAGVNVSYTEDTNWHMLTITRSGPVVNFYIDGEQVGTEQSLSANADLFIQYVGRFGSGAYNAAGTLMDEIYINSAVLSSAEILALYGGGTPKTCGSPAGLSNGVFYDNFEGDTLPTVTDLIGSVVQTAQNMENDEIKNH